MIGCLIETNHRANLSGGASSTEEVLMDIALFLSVAACSIQVLAYILYVRMSRSGSIVPNMTMWTIGLALVLLNASTYVTMTGDLVKAALPIVSSCAYMWMYAQIVRRGSFGHIDTTNAIIVVLGVAASLVWYLLRSAMYVNFILVGAIVISFVPLFRSAWRDPSTEKPLPWSMWTSAYAISLVVVMLRWRDQPQDLVFPICMMLIHGTVAVLSIRRVAS